MTGENVTYGKEVSMVSYMSGKAFVFGYEDAANSRGWRRGYDKWKTASQLEYEAGRQLAIYIGVGKAPKKLKNGAKINHSVMVEASHMHYAGYWI